MPDFGPNPEHKYEVKKYRDQPQPIERKNMAKQTRITLLEQTKYAMV